MRIYPIIFGFASLALIIPQINFAADKGFYINGNLGQSFVQESNVPGSVDSKDGFGANASLGYLFNPHIAFELGYTDYADADITQSGTEGDDSRYSYDAAFKFIYPTKHNASIFLKLGVGTVYSSLDDGLTRDDGKDNDQENTNILYGAGLMYQINDWFALSAQYETIVGNDEVGNSSLASFGFVWNLSKSLHDYHQNFGEK